MRPAIYSKARIGGHPIHPMLVHFPIALFVGGLLSLLAYMAIGDVFWYRAATVAFIAGAAMAALAAVFGSIDLFGGIPPGTAARRTGLQHMGLNVLALLVFTGAGIVMWLSYDTHVRQPVSDLNVATPLVLSILGTIVLSISGALGSKLVYKQHVGQQIDEEGTAAPGMPAQRPL